VLSGCAKCQHLSAIISKTDRKKRGKFLLTEKKEKKPIYLLSAQDKGISKKLIFFWICVGCIITSRSYDSAKSGNTDHLGFGGAHGLEVFELDL